MLTVNPSKSELKFIDNDEEKFKSYVKDVMDKYAEHFDRNYKDGRKLTGNDIKYYVKIEHERTYKFNEKRFREPMQHNLKIEKKIFQLKKEVFNNTKSGNEKENKSINKNIQKLDKQYIRNNNGVIIKEGNLKDGNNIHAHIIVARYDKEKAFKLSPMINNKKSFNRSEFVGIGEKLFDDKFNYNRSYEESYKYYKEGKLINGAQNLLHLRDPKTFAKMVVKKAVKEMIEDKTLQKGLGYATTNPKNIPRKVVNDLEKKAIESVLKSLDAAAYTTPVTAAVQVAKKVIQIASRTISKGMGI